MSGSPLTHTLLWAGMDGAWVGKAGRFNDAQKGQSCEGVSGRLYSPLAWVLVPPLTVNPGAISSTL